MRIAPTALAITASALIAVGLGALIDGWAAWPLIIGIGLLIGWFVAGTRP